MDDWPLLVIVDDEAEILKSIKRTLMRIDVRVEAFTSPRLALEFIVEQKPFMIISDQRMPDIQGMELLAKVKGISPNTKRIMLSAFQDFDVVSSGFNQGVIEQFIAKPWNNLELQTLVNNNMPANKKAVTDSLSTNMLGEHVKMLTLFEDISKAAGANVPIFIHGETGTGKELVAKACHEQGCKQSGRFIAVNCANFSEHLVESQLFGHKKGAFTGATSDQVGVFAAANGGTVFLDEITTLPLALQSKLLRVIQEREYSPVGSLEVVPFDSQIISASSESLVDAVLAKQFREDLLYRLNVISLKLPPLRARGNDIILLSLHFLKIYSQEQSKSFINIDNEAQALLLNYTWPGNVRQLENIIHSLCIMHDGSNISAGMVTAALSNVFTLTQQADTDSKNNANHSQIGSTAQLIKPLHEIERQAIEKAIESSDGNIAKAAVLLEVNPSTLYRKIKSWQ